MTNCYFCDTVCETRPTVGAATTYECPNCGLYDLSYSFISRNDDPSSLFNKNKHLIAGYLFETKDNPDWNFRQLTEEKVKIILNDFRVPKTTIAKTNKLLIYMYRVDENMEYSFAPEKNTILAAYAKNDKEVLRYFNFLSDLGYGKLDGNKIKLTTQGAIKAEELLSTNKDSRKVFIAMEFNHTELDEMVQKAINPACNECDFQAGTVERNHNQGITDQIIADIRASKFVIVDFTYGNQGAYFEAGFAQGLGRPIIRICNKKWFDDENQKKNGKALHFDIRHYNVIMWDDLDTLKKDLKANIRANISGAKLEDFDDE